MLFSYPIAGVSQEVLVRLMDHDYPGNVRELRNILEQASILSENGVIELHNLPEVILKHSKPNMVNNIDNDMAIDDKLELMEKEIIIAALRKTSGIQVKAANILGINQRSLWHRIKKFDIDINTFRNLQ